MKITAYLFVLTTIIASCTFSSGPLTSLKSDPVMSIRTEKNAYYIDEEINFEVIIACKNHEPCMLDTGIFRRIQPINLWVHLMRINHAEDNVGLQPTVYDSSSESFFVLQPGTFIGCKNSLDLKDVKLSPGDYELEVKIQGGKLSPNLEKTISDLDRERLFIGPLYAKIQFTLLGRENSAKSE